MTSSAPKAWGIFATGTIDVRIDLNTDPNAMPAAIANYEFTINTHPADTGFYVVDSGDYECTPGSEGFSESPIWRGGNLPKFELIRCGLGKVSNNGFEVKARRGPTTYPEISLGRTGKILQAWHREAGEVTYKRDLSNFSGTRPTNVPPTYYDRPTLDTAITRAEVLLDYVLGGDPFREDSSGEVTIRPFWEPAAECGGVAGRIACYLIGGVFPHLSPETLWVKYPPLGQTRINVGSVTQLVWREWTNKVNLVNTNPDRYLYLPQVMVHEFGHTLGVLHLPEVVPPDFHIMDDIFNANIGTTNMTLSDSDKAGLLETLQSHIHPP